MKNDKISVDLTKRIHALETENRILQKELKKQNQELKKLTKDKRKILLAYLQASKTWMSLYNQLNQYGIQPI